MNLRFMRKLGRSEGNRGSQLTIPRPVAQTWAENGVRDIEMVFSDEGLLIRPVVT